MMASVDQVRVELDPALFLRITGAAGSVVVCIEGYLWITRDGCPKDTTLAPGESYCIEGATRTIVTAFEPSLARVSQPVLQEHRTKHRPLEVLRHIWESRLAVAA